eukprot:scaffold158639_cov21-Tisochrysis_lutea.AAC.2
MVARGAGHLYRIYQGLNGSPAGSGVRDQAQYLVASRLSSDRILLLSSLPSRTGPAAGLSQPPLHHRPSVPDVEPRIRSGCTHPGDCACLAGAGTHHLWGGGGAVGWVCCSRGCHAAGVWLCGVGETVRACAMSVVEVLLAGLAAVAATQQ